MTIEKLSIVNFKGIDTFQEFKIRPITLFIGPNSSGKSTCLHAMAALAQTVKLAGSKLPIVLDDEFAQVHLGRFIEVIHSKTYTDPIEIGITYTAPRTFGYTKANRQIKKGEQITATFSFKSTKRTQDIYIDKVTFKTNRISLIYTIKSSHENYNITYNSTSLPVLARHVGGLKFSLMPDFPGEINNDFFEILTLNEGLNDYLAEELRNTLYLGPFRQSPIRRYPTRGSVPLEVGSQGESAVTMLANEYVQTKSRKHTKQISQWMSMLGLAKSIDVSRVGNSDLFNVAATLSDDKKLPIADLGYGVSQVLPVLAQCSFATKGATLLFEQPELHLHPTAAGNLASIFSHAIKDKERQIRIIAETHSIELFFKIINEVREGRISLDEIAAYKVTRENGHSNFENINITQEEGITDVETVWANVL